jgi:hypothetical protein
MQVTEDIYNAMPSEKVVNMIGHELFHVRKLDAAQHILTIDGAPIPPDLLCSELNGRIVVCTHIDKVLIELEAKSADTQAKFIATNAQDDKHIAAHAIARKAAHDADVALGQASLAFYYAKNDHENAMAKLRDAKAKCVASSIETSRTYDESVAAIDALREHKLGEKRKRD